MRDTIKRERKVDVNKLTTEQADLLSQEIGNKIRKIVDEACETCNNFLQIYGLQTKMQIVIEPKENNTSKTEEK
jgi:hypothetical protein